ncbi:hypothetical protein AVEN_27546-1 [Araneus ventricosus]|uniref:Uncharacterized protein n=1 Tax=Araneus ventricosus TaxID=182803 RepID=A0A4Y2PE95_ARAVE|nr:hypothetical protein AVEN_247794-1 [Araneus ventricosus]GBN50285.1 hypothetical protein AVEN_27546-1 [Araneus ventricosus]
MDNRNCSTEPRNHVCKRIRGPSSRELAEKKGMASEASREENTPARRRNHVCKRIRGLSSRELAKKKGAASEAFREENTPARRRLAGKKKWGVDGHVNKINNKYCTNYSNLTRLTGC